VESFCQIVYQDGSNSIDGVVHGAEDNKIVSLLKWSRAKLGLTWFAR
jgi:hypothetical protein